MSRKQKPNNKPMEVSPKDNHVVDYTGTKRLDSTAKRDRFDVCNKDNDFKWYNMAPEALKYAATISFRESVGNPIRLTTSVTVQTPGVCVLNTLFGPGFAEDDQDPINLAIKEVQTFITSRLNKNWQYPAPDTAQCIWAYEELSRFYYEACRAVRLMTDFDMDNNYKPKALVETLGFDYDDIMNNMSDWLSELDQEYAMFKAFPIPKDFSIIEKHLWFVSNIFGDTSTKKHQIYAFRSTGWREFVETHDDPDHPETYTGGKLVYHGFEGKRSLTTQRTTFRTMFNALRGSEDWINIMGNIKNAYGDNLYQVDHINQMPTLELLDAHHVLMQIHNCFMPGGPEVRDADITQDPDLNKDYLIYHPLIQTNAGVAAMANTVPYKAVPWYPDTSYLIDLDADQPSVEDVTEMTRLMFTGTFESFSGEKVLFTRLESGGDMIIVNANFSFFDNNGTLQTYQRGTMLDLDTAHYHFLSIAEAFNWAPQFIVAGRTVPSDDVGYYARIGALDNFTALSRNNLDDINRVVLKSMWGVPRQI